MNTDNKIQGNALGYARVSTDEQAQSGLSIDVQIDKIKSEAQKTGLNLLKIYSDEGKTGTNTNREGLQSMLAHCKEEKISAVIVQDTSRISRETVDYLSIKQVLRDYKVQIVSLNQPMAQDDNPYSQFVDEVTAAANALHPRVTSMKVKITTDAKFEFGLWPSWAPQGYKNIENPNPTCQYDIRIIVPDPIKGRLVIKTFRLYSTGEYSYLKLCKIMYKKGLTARSGDKMMSVSSMQQMIGNSFYYGLMKRNGKEKMGKHKPLITKALFDQCQFVAAQHRNFLVRERKHKYLLRGHVFCMKHGRRLTAEAHPVKSKKPKTVSYYHCTMPGGCKGTYLEADLLEKRIANLFKRYEFSKEFIELVRTKVKAYFEDNRKNLASERRGILNKRKAVEVKRNKLEDLLVEGTITRDVFKRQHAKFQNKINQHDNDLSELEAKHNIDVKMIDEVLALTRNIYQTYLDAPDYLKRHYLRFFFEGIYIKDKRIAKVVETPLFSTLRRQNKVIIRSNWLPGLDSNQRPAGYTKS